MNFGLTPGFVKCGPEGHGEALMPEHLAHRFQVPGLLQVGGAAPSRKDPRNGPIWMDL